MLGGLEANTRKVLTEVVRAALPYLRFGPLDTDKAENFAGYKITSTTATSTSEFSVEHGIGRTPYLMLPVVDLSAVGSALVPLEVTRAADDRRLYFKTTAGSTNLPFSIYVEG